MMIDVLLSFKFFGQKLAPPREHSSQNCLPMVDYMSQKKITFRSRSKALNNFYDLLQAFSYILNTVKTHKCAK